MRTRLFHSKQYRYLALCLSLGLFNHTAAFAQWEDSAESTAEDGFDSETTLPVAERLQYPTAEQYFNWLSHQVDSQQIRWLEADKKFFALYSEQRSNKERGAIILLPDEGHHAGWPDILGSLQHYLPDYGWHCLALSLPAPEAAPNSKSRDKETNTREKTAEELTPVDSELDEPETGQGEIKETEGGIETAQAVSTTTQSSESIIQQRIKAAMAFLQKQGHAKLVLVSMGNSAVQAAAFIDFIEKDATDSSVQLQALVLIDARSEELRQLPRLLAKLEIPIFDIYHGNDLVLVELANQRRRLLRSQNSKSYQQLRLSAKTPQLDRQADQLAKRVRGWLNKRFKGTPIP